MQENFAKNCVIISFQTILASTYVLYNNTIISVCIKDPKPHDEKRLADRKLCQKCTPNCFHDDLTSTVTLLLLLTCDGGSRRALIDMRSQRDPIKGAFTVSVSVNANSIAQIKLLRFLNQPNEPLQKWVANPIDQI